MCIYDDYVLTANKIGNSYDAATVEYIWKDENGVQVGSNSSTINISSVIVLNRFKLFFQ
jgi:hypothetical protein